METERRIKAIEKRLKALERESKMSNTLFKTEADAKELLLPNSISRALLDSETAIIDAYSDTGTSTFYNGNPGYTAIADLELDLDPGSYMFFGSFGVTIGSATGIPAIKMELDGVQVGNLARFTGTAAQRLSINVLGTGVLEERGLLTAKIGIASGNGSSTAETSMLTAFRIK